MMRGVHVVAVVLLVLAVASAARSVQIEGTVTDDDGPVAGAEVYAVLGALGDRGVVGTRSDPYGRYLLATETGPQWLVVAMAGRETAVVAVSQRRGETDVRLKRGGSPLRGYVRDVDDQPFGEARVAITRMKLQGDRGIGLHLPPDHPIEALRATSGPDGSFEIRGLPEISELTLEGRRHEFGTVIVPLQGLPQEAVMIAMLPQASVRGQVTWRGMPVPGVELSVGRHADWRATTTDRGTYEITRLPPGYTHVSVTAPWMMTAVTRPGALRLTPGARAMDADFELASLSLVTGTVTRADTGEPVEGAAIVDSRSMGTSARTGRDGVYQLRLLPGETTVELRGVRGDGYAFRRISSQMAMASQTVSPAAGELVEDVDFAVEPWMVGEAVVRGVVRMPDGSPAALATLTMDIRTPGTLYAGEPRDAAITDFQGRFELRPNLVRLDEHFVVRAAPARGDLLAAAVVSVRDGEEVELRLVEPAWVRLEAEWVDGEPYDASRISLNAALAGPDDSALPWKAERRVEGHALVLGPLPPGLPLAVSAVHPTGRWRSRGQHTLTLQPGETRVLPKLIAVRSDAPVLRGRVLDPNEQPVAGALVFASPYSGPDDAVRSATDGSFEIQPPLSREGRYALLAATEDGGLCRGLWLGDVTDGEHVLVLAEPVMLEGRLLTPDGQPAADVRLEAKGSWWTAQRVAETGLSTGSSCETGPTGHWRLEGLIPGFYYRLEARDRILGAEVHHDIVPLEPGGHERIELKLEPVAAVNPQ